MQMQIATDYAKMTTEELRQHGVERRGFVAAGRSYVAVRGIATQRWCDEVQRRVGEFMRASFNGAVISDGEVHIEATLVDESEWQPVEYEQFFEVFPPGLSQPLRAYGWTAEELKPQWIFAVERTLAIRGRDSWTESQILAAKAELEQKLPADANVGKIEVSVKRIVVSLRGGDPIEVLRGN